MDTTLLVEQTATFAGLLASLLVMKGRRAIMGHTSRRMESELPSKLTNLGQETERTKCEDAQGSKAA